MFIFGAGASKAEGAPTTNELLLKSLIELGHEDHILPIKNFLSEFFFVDFDSPEKLDSRIPTFEEMLTIIDNAIIRTDDLSSHWTYDQLTELRMDLIYSIARILEVELRNKGIIHRKFVDTLFTLDDRNNKNTSFICLNYDLLLDNALMELYVNKDWDLDYEIPFSNVIPSKRRKIEARRIHLESLSAWHLPRKDRGIYLLKLHGSLNWLYCPNCNNVETTKREKGVLKIWTEYKQKCHDGSLQRPIIVPPTWQKSYDIPHLGAVWQKAAELLGKADQAFFIGYSLPESDIRCQYLFKKFLYRSSIDAQPRISVVTQPNGNEETAKRFKRIFGANTQVLPIGFQAFSNDVTRYLSDNTTKQG